MTLQASRTCAAADLCVHDCSHRAAKRELQHIMEPQLLQQIFVLPGSKEKTGQHEASSTRAEALHVYADMSLGPCSGQSMPVAALCGAVR